MADDEDKAKAEKLAAARKRVAQMQKQKGKKTTKKAAAGDAGKGEASDAAAATKDEDKPDTEPTEPEAEKEPVTETKDEKETAAEVAAEKEEDEPQTEPMPDAPTSPGPETSPGEVVRELPTRGLHARQPSLSMQSKNRSSSFRTSISTTVSPVAGVKSPPPLPPLAPDSEQVHEVFRRQAARVEELEKENKKLEKDLDDANSRREKSENELEDLRESSVEVVELKDRLEKAEKQVTEMESLRTEIASLQRQNSLLQSKTQRASNAGHSESPQSELAQELESKSSTIEAMELEISNLRAQLSSESTSSNGYQGQITALEEKLSRSESALDKTKQELADTKQSLSRASEKAVKEGVDKTSTETLIKSLRREIEELQEAKTTSEKRAETLDKKLQALGNLHKESETRHQTRLKDHEKLEKELTLLKKKLASVENENLRLREEKERSKKREAGVEGNESLDELEDEERGRLERRVRELESENFDLRRGVWKERRKELGGNEGEEEFEASTSPGNTFDEVDLIGGAPSHSRRRSLMMQNRSQQQQHSSFATVISSGLAAFTGGTNNNGASAQNHPPAARGSLELLAEEDNDEFDEDAFARAQAEEEARKRVEWAREVKRKLRDWKGWRLDLVDSRAGAEGAGVALGEIFEVEGGFLAVAMNGYSGHDLDEDAFGEKSSAGSGLRTFDAFPKTKPSYVTPTRRGGQWTVIIYAVCTILSLGELLKWYRGTENQHFSVEKGVSRELQMNLDMVVKMPCADLRINVQDASGDHIMAGMLLTKDNTNWELWNNKLNQISAGEHEYQTLNAEDTNRLLAQEEDIHAHHVIQHVRRNPRRKFPRTPRLSSKYAADSCRIYGSLEGNKVQGDFHITARGHGYTDVGQHLDHAQFNFSHMITELSFGPHYPSLLNPLDKTMSTTETHYYKYQYFLNIVPTIYSRGNGIVEKYTSNPRNFKKAKNTIFTNQYSATSQSLALPENPWNSPGIFFKYNIEPVLLFVNEERGSFLALLVRLVNVVSGVIVTGGWLFQLSSWALETFRRRRTRRSEGVLNGRSHSAEYDE